MNFRKIYHVVAEFEDFKVRRFEQLIDLGRFWVRSGLRVQSLCFCQQGGRFYVMIPIRTYRIMLRSCYVNGLTLPEILIVRIMYELRFATLSEVESHRIASGQYID